VEDLGHKWTLSALLRHLKANNIDTISLMQVRAWVKAWGRIYETISLRLFGTFSPYVSRILDKTFSK
jgi:hypothetical protein